MEKTFCLPKLLWKQPKEKVKNLEKKEFFRIKEKLCPNYIFFSKDIICLLDQNGKFVKIRQHGIELFPPIQVTTRPHRANQFLENAYHIILKSSDSIHIFCRKTMKILYFFQNKSIENIVSIDKNRILLLTRNNNLYEIFFAKNDFKIRTINNFKWENSFRIKFFSYFGNGIVFVGNFMEFIIFDIVKEKKIYKEYETSFRCVTGLEFSTNFVVATNYLVVYEKNRILEYTKHIIPSSKKGKNNFYDYLKCLENDKILTLSSSLENKITLEIYDVSREELLYQYVLNEFEFVPNIFLYNNFILCQGIKRFILVLENPFYTINRRNLQMVISASNKSETNDALTFFQNFDVVECISHFLFF